MYHPAFPHCNQEALTQKPSLPVHTSFHCSQTLACKCQQRGLVIFATVHSKLTGNRGQVKLNSIRYAPPPAPDLPERWQNRMSWKQAWGSYCPAPPCAGHVALGRRIAFWSLNFLIYKMEGTPPSYEDWDHLSRAWHPAWRLCLPFLVTGGPHCRVWQPWPLTWKKCSRHNGCYSGPRCVL